MNLHLGIQEKIKSTLSSSKFDAVLLVGWDNVAYASGYNLPFAPYRYSQKIVYLYTNTDQFYCICPNELISTIKNLGFEGCLIGYQLMGNDDRNLLSTLSKIINRFGDKIKTLGMDFNRVGQGFFEKLQEGFGSKIMILDASQWVIDLRKIKTDQELALLEDVAYKVDHGINGYFHHVLADRPAGFILIAEFVRVHCMERFLDEVGYNNVARVLDCEPSMRLYPYCKNHGFNYGYSPTKKTQTGQMYSVSMTASKNGYYSEASRILCYGSPDEEQRGEYEKINILRGFILDNLKPGIRCDDLAKMTIEHAKENNITIVPGIAFGHGIGVLTNEAPYLSEDSQEILEKGMVLVLDQSIIGKNKQIFRSKDTVIITENGYKLVNWWKDWREPYHSIPFV